MSEERNFDDRIRQEFKNYSPGVPSHIWDNIVAEREKRKPVGFWFNLFSSKNLVGLIALIIVGSAGGLIISHSFTSTETHSKMSTGDNTFSPVANNNIGNKKEELTVKDETKNLPVAKSINNNSGNNPEKQLNNDKANSTITIIQPSLSSSSAEKNSNTQVVKRSHSISATQEQTLVNNDEINNTRTTSTINTEKRSIADDISTTQNAFPDKSVNKNIARKNVAGFAMKNYYPATSRLLFSAVEKPFFNISSAQPSLQQKNSAIAHLPECPTIEKDAAGNKRYFEIYIAPDYALRTLTDTANSVYLQKRKQSTQFSSAFSAGVRYTKVFSNGMSVRAALNYSQINEKFSFVQGNLVQITYTIDPNTGDTTGSYTVRGTRYKTTYNHYHSIDIPLTIGYEFGNGRFHTNINAGLIANIYSWQKGDVLDTNYQPVSITTGKGSSIYQFKTNVGLGATAGVSFYYKLTDQLHFLAEPYIRYNFQPMSSANLTLRQKYTTMGLRLGLRLDLPYPGSIIKR